MVNATTRVSMLAVFIATLFTLIGSQTREVAGAERLWSVVIHFRYQDGFEFDYVLQRNVATADLPAALAECGGWHSTRSVVRSYCYPVAE